MTEHKYTDDRIIELLLDKAEYVCKNCGLIKESVGCDNCIFSAIKQLTKLIATQRSEIKQYKHEQEKLIAERDEARRDCAVAESRNPTFIKVNNTDISDDVRRAIKSGKVVLMQSNDPQVELILDYQTIINDFKSALLKKIFPYDAADKKQYSINAYAVERAIVEVADELICREEVTSHD